MQIEVTDSNFSADILQSRVPVLVDYDLPTCPYCAEIQSTLNQLSNDLAGVLTVADLLWATIPRTLNQYDVYEFPTLMIFQNGEVVATEAGELPADQLTNWVEAGINISSSDTVKNFLSAYNKGLLYSPVEIADTPINVQANLSSLQAAAASGKIGSILLTGTSDANPPIFQVTMAQLSQDSAVLGDMAGGYYYLKVTGVSVANAASIMGQSHVSAVVISDSSSNILSNLDLLNELIEPNLIATDIILTDPGIPDLSITAAQLTADSFANPISFVIGAISSAYTLTVAAGSSAVSITSPSGHGTTVTFAGDADTYSVTAPDSTLTVSSGGVSDTLTNVTALQFADFTEIVAQAPASGGGATTGNIAELYSAVLAREPDVAGLAFYQNYLASNPNTPLLQFAEWFLSSPEYTSEHSYAQTTAGDTQFITDSYQNLLHRAPAASDITYYLNNVINPALKGLTPGTQAYTNAEFQAHAQMLVYFSASPEFLSDVQVTATNPASAQHWLVLTGI